jgi:hypothetical protein
MASSNDYQPRAEHKFSFGLWTVGNRGRDPFGDFVRPLMAPNDIVAMLRIYGLTKVPSVGDVPLYQKPLFWAAVILVIVIVLNIIFW